MLKLYDDNNIKAIADAIRARNGTQDTYKVSEMAGAISSLARSVSAGVRVVTSDKACGLTQNGGTITITGVDANGLTAIYLARCISTGDMVASSNPSVSTLFINALEGKVGLSYHFRSQKSSTYYSYGVALNAELDASITPNDNGFSVICSDLEDVAIPSSTAGSADGWKYTAIYAG